MLSHGCALFTKMLASGRNQLGSSNVQTRTPTISGRVDTCTYRGVPHSSQKARVISFPESAFATYCLGVPRINLNSVAGMRTAATCGAPLWRWQSRQWHCSENCGSSPHSYRTAPQRHPPALTISHSSPLSSMAPTLSSVAWHAGTF
jgi:hypothetical protein